jgi:hypothetical protein
MIFFLIKKKIKNLILKKMSRFSVSAKNQIQTLKLERRKVIDRINGLSLDQLRELVLPKKSPRLVFLPNLILTSDFESGYFLLTYQILKGSYQVKFIKEFPENKKFDINSDYIFPINKNLVLMRFNKEPYGVLETYGVELTSGKFVKMEKLARLRKTNEIGKFFIFNENHGFIIFKKNSTLEDLRKKKWKEEKLDFKGDNFFQFGNFSFLWYYPQMKISENGNDVKKFNDVESYCDDSEKVILKEKYTNWKLITIKNGKLVIKDLIIDDPNLNDKGCVSISHGTFGITGTSWTNDQVFSTFIYAVLPFSGTYKYLQTFTSLKPVPVGEENYLVTCKFNKFKIWRRDFGSKYYREIEIDLEEFEQEGNDYFYDNIFPLDSSYEDKKEVIKLLTFLIPIPKVLTELSVDFL